MSHGMSHQPSQHEEIAYKNSGFGAHFRSFCSLKLNYGLRIPKINHQGLSIVSVRYKNGKITASQYEEIHYKTRGFISLDLM
jgi:hypothetical protein